MSLILTHFTNSASNKFTSHTTGTLDIVLEFHVLVLCVLLLPCGSSTIVLELTSRHVLIIVIANMGNY